MYLRWTATVLYLPPWSKHWARYGAPPSWEDSSCLHSLCWPYKKKPSGLSQVQRTHREKNQDNLRPCRHSKVLKAMCHSEWCAVSYRMTPLPSGRDHKNPRRICGLFQRRMDWPRAKRGKKKKNEGRQQRSGRATHSGLCMSNKFISLDTNSSGENWLKIIMEENTRIQITRCRQAVIALWWQGPIESRI